MAPVTTNRCYTRVAANWASDAMTMRLMSWMTRQHHHRREIDAKVGIGEGQPFPHPVEYGFHRVRNAHHRVVGIGTHPRKHGRHDDNPEIQIEDYGQQIDHGQDDILYKKHAYSHSSW